MINKSSELHLNVAVITGASKGIGSEIAIKLSSSGIFVYIIHRNSQQHAESVLETIKRDGGCGRIVQCDVTSEHDVDTLIEEVKREFGYVDYLVNNAGIDLPSKFSEYKYNAWKKIVETNLCSKFLITQKFVPLLQNASDPRVINLSSRLAYKPLEGSSAYCCSAAAIAMLTKCSALELKEFGIKVNTIMPGLTKTPMTEAFIHDDEVWKEAAKRNPSGRLGQPSDISSVVEFLILGDSSFINGTEIIVDGGSLLL